MAVTPLIANDSASAHVNANTNASVKKKPLWKKIPRNFLLRMLYDMAMLIVFVSLASSGAVSIFGATYALMGMTLLRAGAIFATKDSFKKLDWVEFIAVIAFGLATTLLHSALFIKLKPPVLASAFALGMIALSIYKKEPFSKALAEDFKLPKFPDKAWKTIDYLILADCFINTAVNLTVIFLFSTEIWALTKIPLMVFDFSILGAMIYVFTRYGMTTNKLFESVIQHEELPPIKPILNPPVEKNPVSPTPSPNASPSLNASRQQDLKVEKVEGEKKEIEVMKV